MRNMLAGLACVLALVTGCAASTNEPGTSTSTSAAKTGSGSTATTSPDAIQTWFHQVNPQISTVEQSITYAQWMVRRPSHRGLAAACRAIATHITTYEKLPEAPDATTRSALRRQMSAFRDASRQCLAGDLDAAGHSVNVGHHWAEIAGRRVVHLLHTTS